MTPSYEYYKIFYYVATCKSFNKAAKALVNSQPNITRSINNLESALGCRLFDRSHRGVTLTPEGEELFSYVAEAHEKLTAGEAFLMGRKENSHDNITLGFAADIAGVFLKDQILPSLETFKRQFRTVTFKIVTDTSSALLRDTLDEKLDLAIITSKPLGRTGVLTRSICEFNDMAIAGKGYEKLLSKKKVSIAELVEYPFIALRSDSAAFLSQEKFFLDNGVRICPFIEAATAEQLLFLVEADMGIGFISELLASPYIKEGKIIKVDLKEKLPKRTISLTRNRHNAKNAVFELEKHILNPGT